MGNVEAAALIIGIVMPLLITLLKQTGWSGKVNMIVAIVACAGAGVLTAWASGLFTGTAIIVAIATIFSIAQVEYRLFFNNLEAKLNETTSIVKCP